MCVILKFEFMDESVTCSLAPWFKSDSKAFSSCIPSSDILCDKNARIQIVVICMYVTISALSNVVATRAAQANKIQLTWWNLMKFVRKLMFHDETPERIFTPVNFRQIPSSWQNHANFHSKIHFNSRQSCRRPIRSTIACGLSAGTPGPLLPVRTLLMPQQNLKPNVVT